MLERAIALQEKGPSFRVRLYAESLLELVELANDPNNTPRPNARMIERARRQLCEYDKLFDEGDRKTRNYHARLRHLRGDLRTAEGRARDVLSARASARRCAVARIRCIRRRRTSNNVDSQAYRPRLWQREHV